MPAGVRTNKGSSKVVRRRASALLTAGCDSPRFLAATDIPRVFSTSRKITSKLRSRSRRFIAAGIHDVNDEYFSIGVFNGLPHRDNLPTGSWSGSARKQAPLIP